MRGNRNGKARKVILLDTMVVLHLIYGPLQSQDEPYCQALNQVLANIPKGAVSLCVHQVSLMDKPRNAPQNLLELILERERLGFITVLKEWTFIDGEILRDNCEEYIERNRVEYERRYFAHSQSTGNPNKLSLGDYQVLNAALLSEVDELWTHDPGLLALSDTEVVYGLRICRPNSTDRQGVLEL